MHVRLPSARHVPTAMAARRFDSPPRGARGHRARRHARALVTTILGRVIFLRLDSPETVVEFEPRPGPSRKLQIWADVFPEVAAILGQDFSREHSRRDAAGAGRDQVGNFRPAMRALLSVFSS